MGEEETRASAVVVVVALTVSKVCGKVRAAIMVTHRVFSTLARRLASSKKISRTLSTRKATLPRRGSTATTLKASSSSSSKTTGHTIDKELIHNLSAVLATLLIWSRTEL